MPQHIPFPGGAPDGATNTNFQILEARRELEGKVARKSVVMGVVSVCPDEDGAGGNTRFAAEHGLGAVPDYTHAFVRSVQLADGQMGSENTVQSSLVVIQPCAPPPGVGLEPAPWAVADQKYSYFTIGTPYKPWHGDIELDAVLGNGSVTFDASWGVPRTAAVNYNTGASFSVAPGWDISGQTVNVLGAGSAILHINVFFGFPPGTKIEVVCRSVIGEVWDRFLPQTTDVQMHAVP
jgi:hypothetical protein